MHDPQDDEATREAEAVDATEMAPTAMSAPGSGSVVDAFAWSQEDGSGPAEPVPYVEDPYYEPDLGTGRRPTVLLAPPDSGRRTPSLLPRAALGFGIVVALIAVAGALFSLTGGDDEQTPTTPTSSAIVVPPIPPPAPEPTTTAAPPVTTTAAPPVTTTTPPPVTTTTTAPPTTTTTTAPSTTTTTVTTTTAPPTTTTTAPPTSSEPPVTTTSAAPPTTTAAMTTEYLTIPFVPVPIPITVPQN
ncbi:hypothetical protein [Mycolicibacter minnesotensis]